MVFTELATETSALLVQAGRCFRQVLVLDATDGRALLNWGNALCLRASIRTMAGRRGGEGEGGEGEGEGGGGGGGGDAMELYDAAIEKYDAALLVSPAMKEVEVARETAYRDMQSLSQRY